MAVRQMAKKRKSKPNYSKMTSDELKAAFDDEWTTEELGPWQMEMVTRSHDINEKYGRYLEPSSFRGCILRHPLLVEHCDPGRGLMTEWIIESKEGDIKRLKEKNKWYQVIFMYANPYLLDAFRKNVKHFDNKTYWKILAAVWTQQEQLWRKRKVFLNLLQSPRPERQCLMSAPERRKLDGLPNVIPVFRGFTGARGVKGMSWTLDQKKAEWFAKRYAAIEHIGPPKLAKAKAKKKDVLAYFNGRKEKEIVIDPEKLTAKTVSKVDFDPDAE